MSKQKHPDSVIYQLIEEVYRPALSWETCDQVLTDDQIYVGFAHLVNDQEHLTEILKTLHFKRAFNEHNRKYYWLVNLVV